MNALEDRHDGSSTNPGSRAIHEFGAGYRLVVPIVACIMLLLGASHWLNSGRDAQAISAAPSQQAAGATAATSDYFPAQYVNQAKEAGEHIQAF